MKDITPDRDEHFLPILTCNMHVYSIERGIVQYYILQKQKII
jgi:hypothetical protein